MTREQTAFDGSNGRELPAASCSHTEPVPTTAAASDNIRNAPFETALHHAGSGRFQWLLLGACGAVYATCAVSTTTLSFVLPAAECDFRLSSADKGKLNATPLIGMCVGSYIWGNLADARGRKRAIVASLLVDAIAALVSSFATSFPLFLTCRFFSGFGIIGATGLVFPYFGDFLSLRHRDVMLCRLEVFWTIGTILLPAFAWGVIPQTALSWGALEDGGFRYSSWRAFVALCGAPSLLVAAVIATFPESPRFLLHSGRSERALGVLRTIYSANTRRAPHTFPVESMLETDENCEDVAADSTAQECAKPPQAHRTWAERRQAFWQRKRLMFSRAYFPLLALVCFVDFGLMFSYYTLMMWFPDLLERFAQYTDAVPAGVCEVSAWFSARRDNATVGCTNAGVAGMVYVYTLVIGLSCLPTSIGLGITINRVGKKIMLVCMLISSGLAALGLILVSSSLQNLILSCVFEAIISCTEAVLFCVICEIFPTSVAGTATATAVMFGRIGAIVGNVLFGALVDDNCRLPIYIFGGLLISSGLLCLMLPRSTRPERLPAITLPEDCAAGDN